MASNGAAQAPRADLTSDEAFTSAMSFIDSLKAVGRENRATPLLDKLRNTSRSPPRPVVAPVAPPATESPHRAPINTFTATATAAAAAAAAAVARVPPPDAPLYAPPAPHLAHYEATVSAALAAAQVRDVSVSRAPPPSGSWPEAAAPRPVVETVQQQPDTTRDARSECTTRPPPGDIHLTETWESDGRSSTSSPPAPFILHARAPPATHAKAAAQPPQLEQLETAAGRGDEVSQQTSHATLPPVPAPTPGPAALAPAPVSVPTSMSVPAPEPPRSSATSVTTDAPPPVAPDTSRLSLMDTTTVYSASPPREPEPSPDGDPPQAPTARAVSVGVPPMSAGAVNFGVASPEKLRPVVPRLTAIEALRASAGALVPPQPQLGVRPVLTATHAPASHMPPQSSATQNAPHREPETSKTGTAPAPAPASTSAQVPASADASVTERATAAAVRAADARAAAARLAEAEALARALPNMPSVHPAAQAPPAPAPPATMRFVAPIISPALPLDATGAASSPAGTPRHHAHLAASLPYVSPQREVPVALTLGATEAAQAAMADSSHFRDLLAAELRVREKKEEAPVEDEEKKAESPQVTPMRLTDHKRAGATWFENVVVGIPGWVGPRSGGGDMLLEQALLEGLGVKQPTGWVPDPDVVANFKEATRVMRESWARMASDVLSVEEEKARGAIAQEYTQFIDEFDRILLPAANAAWSASIINESLRARERILIRAALEGREAPVHTTAPPAAEDAEASTQGLPQPLSMCTSLPPESAAVGRMWNESALSLGVHVPAPAVPQNTDTRGNLSFDDGAVAQNAREEPAEKTVTLEEALEKELYRKIQNALGEHRAAQTSMGDEVAGEEAAEPTSVPAAEPQVQPQVQSGGAGDRPMSPTPPVAGVGEVQGAASEFATWLASRGFPDDAAVGYAGVGYTPAPPPVSVPLQGMEVPRVSPQRMATPLATAAAPAPAGRRPQWVRREERLEDGTVISHWVRE